MVIYRLRAVPRGLGKDRSLFIPWGGGDSYVIYKNLVALPPLDDLNVEDPPYKILKNL